MKDTQITLDINGKITIDDIKNCEKLFQKLWEITPLENKLKAIVEILNEEEEEKK